MTTRARIWRDPRDGVWMVQLPGRSEPTTGSLTHAGALQLLGQYLTSDDWWAAHDPLAELPADTPAPRPRSWLPRWFG